MVMSKEIIFPFACRARKITYAKNKGFFPSSAISIPGILPFILIASSGVGERPSIEMTLAII